MASRHVKNCSILLVTKVNAKQATHRNTNYRSITVAKIKRLVKQVLSENVNNWTHILLVGAQ